MLRPFAHPLACMLLGVVAQSLKPVKLFSQQLATFPLLRDRLSLAQQCWIRLPSSSDIVGATHAYYAWITKTYGLYSPHNALPVPNLLGVDPFAHHCQHARNNSRSPNIRVLKQLRRRPQRQLQKTIGLMIKTTAQHVHHHRVEFRVH